MVARIVREPAAMPANAASAASRKIREDTGVHGVGAGGRGEVPGLRGDTRGRVGGQGRGLAVDALSFALAAAFFALVRVQVVARAQRRAGA
ncbi:hypothetical protein GCM10010303_77310 [Streptomyces purpurascens]|nr:hypothetical protein GCM10010303_77310 [Streptomyces purpurascens]